jgi:hypothetical protein
MFQAEFTPTRETSKHHNEETFLTEHPRNVISDGRFHNVPYVLGVVAYESAFFTSKLATIIFVYSLTLVLSRSMGLNAIKCNSQEDTNGRCTLKEQNIQNQS